ncbi:hypothetical protein ACWGQ5_21395 [Streptomyces sp. NPDC055722]
MTDCGPSDLASAPHLRAVKHYFADALTEQQLEELESILNTVRTHLAYLRVIP